MDLNFIEQFAIISIQLKKKTNNKTLLKLTIKVTIKIKNHKLIRYY